MEKLNSIGAKIYTHKDSKYGVVLFNIDGFDSVELTQILDEKYNRTEHNLYTFWRKPRRSHRRSP